MPSALHKVVGGPKRPAGFPVVFLHGFGGDAAQWSDLQTAISAHTTTVSFDLPGHCDSLHYPEAGPPKVAAEAVLENLTMIGHERCHFVGYSMGGAVAGLIALMAPHRVASLTLLAPGGFGPEINFPVLKQWAAACSKEDLLALWPQFVAESGTLSSSNTAARLDGDIVHHVMLRQKPGLIESLVAMMDAMSSRGSQGTLPLDELISADYPVTLIWGDQDRILPVSQARALAGKVALHIVEGMGHSPIVEAPELVLERILNTMGLRT